MRRVLTAHGILTCRTLHLTWPVFTIWSFPTALKLSSRPYSKATRAFNTPNCVFETSRDITRRRFIRSSNGADVHSIRPSGDVFEMPGHIDYSIWYDVERCFYTLTLSQCTLAGPVYTGMPLECHWLTQCTLEHHWKNLVETAPHWNATGES